VDPVRVTESQSHPAGPASTDRVGRFDSFAPSMLRCPFTGPRDLRWLIHTPERGPKAQERLLNAAATTHAEMANSRFTTSSDH
jgi:hypothetical protein